MSRDEIHRRIPHRSPMCLLDEIVSEQEDSIVCRKTFSADEYFLQGHFPNEPVVPGVIQCECCLQAGAVLLSGRDRPEPTEPASPRTDVTDSRLPVATRMDSVKFKRIVRPGDTVEIQVTLRERLSNAYFMTGKVTVGGKLAARLDFACSLAAVTDLAEAPS